MQISIHFQWQLRWNAPRVFDNSWKRNPLLVHIHECTKSTRGWLKHNTVPFERAQLCHIQISFVHLWVSVDPSHDSHYTFTLIRTATVQQYQGHITALLFCIIIWLPLALFGSSVCPAIPTAYVLLCTTLMPQLIGGLPAFFRGSFVLNFMNRLSWVSSSNSAWWQLCARSGSRLPSVWHCSNRANALRMLRLIFFLRSVPIIPVM